MAAPPAASTLLLTLYTLLQAICPPELRPGDAPAKESQLLKRASLNMLFCEVVGLKRMLQHRQRAKEQCEHGEGQ